MKTLLNHQQLALTIERLALSILESWEPHETINIIGIQPRGTLFSNLVVDQLQRLDAHRTINYGKIDITFYRDDVRQNKDIVPSITDIQFNIEKERVLLIDDVLHTGRSIRSAMDALLDYGRPERIELMVLIDRLFSREVPIQPDYVGLSVDTLFEQKVKVLVSETDQQQVILLDN